MTARELKRRIPRKAAVATGAIALLMVVGSAFAVHDEEFQLDGNTTVEAPPGPPPDPNPFANTVYDWESLFTTDPSLPLTGPGNRPTPLATLPNGFTDADFVEDWSMVDGSFQTNDPTTFTQSHDIEDVSDWRCKAANQVTNKGDITNNYVAVYEKNGRKILYFGLEKDQDSGSNNVALWLIQDEISCEGGAGGNGNPFIGNHTAGDVLLVSEFTNGGGVSSIKAYAWVPDINPKPNITTPGVDPNPFAVGADCTIVNAAPYPSSTPLTGAQESDRLCATTNLVEITPAWTHWSFDNGLNNDLRPATYLEGAISLNEFPQFSNVCFNRFLFNTRSSQELTATLFDFSLGSIGTCDGNISITPSATNVVSTPHTFTIVANSLSSAVPTSFVITPSVSPAPDTQSTTCGTPTLSNGGKTATCTLTINGNDTGTFTANASVVINYAGGSSITRDTDPATAEIGSGAGGTGPATKTYVDARINIAASGTNALGTAHTFTVTVQKDSGNGFVAANGVSVTVSLDATSIAGASIMGGTCTTGNTAGSGTCTVIVDSTTTGTALVDAHATVNVAGAVGSANVLVDVEGSKTFGTIGRTKTWVDARINIAASGTNALGTAHTFTVTVQKDSGSGFVAANGVSVTVSLDATSTAGSITGGTCTSGNTAGAGECTVIVQSNVEGSAIVNAHATVTVAGTVGSADVFVDVAGTKTYGTIGRTKTWVDGEITWVKEDVAGNKLGGAVFTVCQTDTYNSDSDSYVDLDPDDCHTVADDVTGPDGPAGAYLDQDSRAGYFKLTNLILGKYSITELTPPTGYHLPDPNPTQTVEIKIGALTDAADNPFVNLRAFRIIVITCDDITHDLVVSEIRTPNGTPIVDSMDADDLAAWNLAHDPLDLTDDLTEAQICGNGTLPSLGGDASFGGLDPGTYGFRAIVPKAI